jgi:hypothetical protein
MAAATQQQGSRAAVARLGCAAVAACCCRRAQLQRRSPCLHYPSPWRLVAVVGQQQQQGGACPRGTAAGRRCRGQQGCSRWGWAGGTAAGWCWIPPAACDTPGAHSCSRVYGLSTAAGAVGVCALVAMSPWDGVHRVVCTSAVEDSRKCSTGVLYTALLVGPACIWVCSVLGTGGMRQGAFLWRARV